MSKRIFKIVISLLILLSLCGCKKIEELPNDAINYESGEISFENEESGYKTIEYNNKVFIMYGSIKPKGFFRDLSYAYGNCLGYVDDDKDDRIYALLNENSDEWLIEYYTAGMMEQPIVLREISTKGKIKVPDIVESFDYDYWKE